MALTLATALLASPVLVTAGIIPFVPFASHTRPYASWEHMGCSQHPPPLCGRHIAVNTTLHACLAVCHDNRLPYAATDEQGRCVCTLVAPEEADAEYSPGYAGDAYSCADPQPIRWFSVAQTTTTLYDRVLKRLSGLKARALTLGNALPGLSSSNPKQPPSSSGTPTSGRQPLPQSAVPKPASRASNPKSVFAHHIVGNTNSYTRADWTADMTLASQYGIDAFALNIGRDAWQSARVSDAYAAAISLGFKLFVSFDMTQFACSTANDAAPLRNYIDAYQNHPAQMYYQNAILVSTFGGEHCAWGDAGWKSAMKTGMPPVHFVPAYFIAPGALASYTSSDGDFNWNGAWPQDNSDASFSSDAQRIAANGGKTFMASVSPWFFTHYGANSYNKNFIYRADDWLFSERWELLVQNRDQVDLVEVLTWNDYGESHYLGQVKGLQPGSQAWVNGFDHTGWLALLSYYASAFKTGTYPPPSQDQVLLWARGWPAGANAPSDSVGRPDNWQWTQDYLWAVVLLAPSSPPSTLTLFSGPSAQSFSVGPGLSKLKVPLVPGQQRAQLARGGGLVVLDMAPQGFIFEGGYGDGQGYNFNARVALGKVGAATTSRSLRPWTMLAIMAAVIGAVL